MARLKKKDFYELPFSTILNSANINFAILCFIAHINHIKNVAGIDHVGLGAGFDGIN